MTTKVEEAPVEELTTEDDDIEHFACIHAPELSFCGRYVPGEELLEDDGTVNICEDCKKFKCMYCNNCYYNNCCDDCADYFNSKRLARG